MVVQEEPEPEEPGRPETGMMGQHESKRPDDVRRHPPQDLALAERLADEAELVLLEVAQSTVDQLGRGGRRARREIIALAQEHREASAGCLAGDAAAIDPAADHGHVEVAPRCAWPNSHRFH
jgi:hypothetical protein